MFIILIRLKEDYSTDYNFNFTIIITQFKYNVRN